MKRKRFLTLNAAGALAPALIPGLGFSADQKSFSEQIMTVTGPVQKSELGLTLPHEHLYSQFGENPEEPGQYDHKSALEKIVPYLRYIQSLGCRTIADCTAAWFGRNVELLEKISRQSGMQIITNTGIYGAVNDRYVPETVNDITAEELAGKWIGEFEQGIGDTAIKPGFIKTGIDSGPLSEVDTKLVRAAAITHHETGLLIQSHTSDNPEAVSEQLNILEEEGVDPSAWVWVHAQNVKEPRPLLDAAGKGARISLDALRIFYFEDGEKQGENTLQHHFSLLKSLRAHRFIDQVLLSHDGSSMPPGGGRIRPFDALFTAFMPMMKAAGFSEEEIDRLTVQNPADAFTIKARLK